MAIPRRVSDRLVRSIGRFQEILKNAKDRDVNESNTVSIVRDIMESVFGYDKHRDITSEFAIRGTYCDLAVKIDGKTEFLIETKAIGLGLKEGHLRQVIDYAANDGTQWVILTNAMRWQVYKVKCEKSIRRDLVCEFSFDELDTKIEENLEKLYIICKEGLAKYAREDFLQKTLAVNRFSLGALILSDDVVNFIRRELRKFSEGVPVSSEEIVQVLRNEVIKREVLDGEEAVKAQSAVRRFYGKIAKRQRNSSENKPNDKTEDMPEDKKETEGQQNA